MGGQGSTEAGMTMKKISRIAALGMLGFLAMTGHRAHWPRVRMSAAAAIG
jgi:hypothetical protein